MQKQQINKAREATRRNRAALLKAQQEGAVKETPSSDGRKRLSDGDKLEHSVYNLVKHHFPKTLKGVYVYVDANRVSEIDIILVHSSGIYIFESKAKKGIIYGDPKERYWTAMHGASTKSRFYNPLKQTEGHARKLSGKFGISPLAVHRVVVFPTKADISRVRYNTSHTMVCTIDELMQVLRGINGNKTEPISPFLLDDIYYELERTQGDKVYQQAHRDAINKAGSRMHMKSRMATRSR